MRVSFIIALFLTMIAFWCFVFYYVPHGYIIAPVFIALIVVIEILDRKTVGGRKRRGVS